MSLDDHTEIELLLPWYATGKISRADARRVEAALAKDAGLKRQLALIQDELAETANVNSSITPARLPDVEKLMVQVARKRRGPEKSVSDWFSQLREAFSGPQRAPLRWAALAAALVLVVQGGVLATLISDRSAGGYQTAGGSETALPAGSYVVVKLNETVSAAELGKALQESDAVIADGPKAQGLYTLRIGDADMSAADRESRLTKLKALSDVFVFVAPLK